MTALRTRLQRWLGHRPKTITPQGCPYCGRDGALRTDQLADELVTATDGFDFDEVAWTALAVLLSQARAMVASGRQMMFCPLCHRVWLRVLDAGGHLQSITYDHRRYAAPHRHD